MLSDIQIFCFTRGFLICNLLGVLVTAFFECQDNFNLSSILMPRGLLLAIRYFNSDYTYLPAPDIVFYKFITFSYAEIFRAIQMRKYILVIMLARPKLKFRCPGLSHAYKYASMKWTKL